MLIKNPDATIESVTKPRFIEMAVVWSISATCEDKTVATRAGTLQKPKTVEHRMVGIN